MSGPTVKLTLLCLALARAELYEGDACTARGGVEGVCRKLSQCPDAMDDIRKRVMPVHCGYDRSSPIVCCPSPNPTTTTTVEPTTSYETTLQSESGTRTDLSTSTDGTSATMCSEYARYVFWEVPNPVLFGDNDEMLNITECGLDSETLIVGGEKAHPKEFPHMVALGYGELNYVSWQCGGSLISDRFVLTAAHCLQARGRGVVRWVRLGDLHLYSAHDDDYAVTMGVEEAIKHEEYLPPALYNDIALLKLNRRVTFTPTIRPACLYSEPAETLGSDAIATGWGKNDAENTEGTEELMKVSLNILPTEDCSRTQRLIVGKIQLLHGIDPLSMICAGGLNTQKDTCQGDSGGPLQIALKSPYCMYSIIGLTSFGSLGCGLGRIASVYTRVSNYIGWIESHVWP